MFKSLFTSQYPSNAAIKEPGNSSAQGSSSAFSASNTDEDWTIIPDLAERRRIQNRIAQRNYRKKLKRRLEDLERRAGTSHGDSIESEQQGRPGEEMVRKPSQSEMTVTTDYETSQIGSVAWDSMPSTPTTEVSEPLYSLLNQPHSNADAPCLPLIKSCPMAAGPEKAPNDVNSLSSWKHIWEDTTWRPIDYRDREKHVFELNKKKQELLVSLKSAASQLKDIPRHGHPDKAEYAVPWHHGPPSATAVTKKIEAGSPSRSSNSSKSEETTDESDNEGLPESHLLVASLPAILRSSLPRFVGWATQRAGTQGVGGNEDSSRGSANKGKATASYAKRKYNSHSRGSGDKDGFDDDDQDSIKRRKASTSNEDDDEGPMLACPFYKKDKIKHSKCLLFRLRRIKDVKQHLARKHMQPQFCARCGRHFDTQECLRSHARGELCVLANFAEPEGVTEDQKKELGTRVGRKFGLAEQWYQVWDILLPLLDRPPSPFVESPIHEVLAGFREYWSENGQNIITEHIQGSVELPYSIPHEERDLASLFETSLRQSMALLVDRCIETYVGQSMPERDVNEVSTHHETTQNGTIPLVIENARDVSHSESTDWWADSGIGMHDRTDHLAPLGTMDAPDETSLRNMRNIQPSALDNAALTSLDSYLSSADMEKFDDWMNSFVKQSYDHDGSHAKV